MFLSGLKVRKSDFKSVQVYIQIFRRTLESLYSTLPVLSDKSGTANTRYTADAPTSHTVYTGLEEREQNIDMRKGLAEMRCTLKTFLSVRMADNAPDLARKSISMTLSW